MSLLPCFQFLTGEELCPTQVFMDTAARIKQPLESIETLQNVIATLRLPWTIKHHPDMSLELLKAQVSPSQKLYFLLRYNHSGNWRWGLVDALHSRLVDTGRPGEKTRILQFGTERRAAFVDCVKEFFLQHASRELFTITAFYSLHTTLLES